MLATNPVTPLRNKRGGENDGTNRNEDLHQHAK